MATRPPPRCAIPLASLALVTSIALSSCSGSGSGDFCEVLLDDTAAAASAFNPPVQEIGDVDAVQARIDLLGQIANPPDELDAPLQLWTEWLGDLRDTWEADPTDVAASVDTSDEVDQARDELFEYYTETCMG